MPRIVTTRCSLHSLRTIDCIPAAGRKGQSSAAPTSSPSGAIVYMVQCRYHVNLLIQIRQKNATNTILVQNLQRDNNGRFETIPEALLVMGG